MTLTPEGLSCGAQFLEFSTQGEKTNGKQSLHFLNTNQMYGHHENWVFRGLHKSIISSVD